ncbi:unnamed protein product [Peniophora sp. CBMAI 1063]|nr:unnamed protein product [Peniophora sp. CBMAI 1063]
MPGWTAPPTRRELLLVLVSVTIFVVAYNADTRLSLLGFSIRPYSPFASARDAPIGPDGRKPAGYRDALEDEIFGTWDWEPDHIAGIKDAEELRVVGKSGEGESYLHGVGLTGQQALWLQGVGEGKYVTDGRLGKTTINEEFGRWGEEVPRTKIVFHEPGFTILENVSMAFGTFFLVTDDPSSMPLPETLGSSMINHANPPRDIDWQILPLANAFPKLGGFGGQMHGTTLVSYDDTTDGLTLLTLQLLYKHLNLSEPPARLILPAVPTYNDPKPPDPYDGNPPRHRSDVGVHPMTLKAAYPRLAGTMFHEDFDDFVGLGTPVLIERLVVVDRGASARAGHSDAPWARLFTSQRDVIRQDWFEDVRQTLWDFLGMEDAKAPGKEVTYLSRQLEGPRMSAKDHEALIKELKKTGVTVHVVDETTPWLEHMNAVVRSSVIVGVTGDHLSNAAFLLPSAHSALVELFPSSAFNADWLTVVRSMGHGYVGFQDTRRLDIASLPPVSRPSRLGEIKIDAAAVARAVQEQLSRH